MAEYTVYERVRKNAKGEETKKLKIKRFRHGITLGQKDGSKHIVLKSTDEKFGDHIKKLGHIFAKSKAEATLKAMLGLIGGNHAK